MRAHAKEKVWRKHLECYIKKLVLEEPFPFLAFSAISYKGERRTGMEDDGGELLFELEGTERYLVHAMAKAV